MEAAPTRMSRAARRGLLARASSWEVLCGVRGAWGTGLFTVGIRGVGSACVCCAPAGILPDAGIWGSESGGLNEGVLVLLKAGSG